MVYVHWSPDQCNIFVYSLPNDSTETLYVFEGSEELSTLLTSKYISLIKEINEINTKTTNNFFLS
jgi:hypothetical protein